MHPRRHAAPLIVMLMSALYLFVPSAHTQQMTEPSDYPISFGGAAGLLIPTGDISNGASTGWNLQAFVDWMSRTQPFGLRGDISYGSLSGKNITSGTTSIDFDDLNLFSITGDGVWMIHPSPGSESRTTPYVRAGIGLYHMSQSSTALGEKSDHNSTNFGVNFGGGVLYRLTGFSAFGEIRYHNVFDGADDGSAKYIPIMVGLRFGGGGR
jgi:opacity protein-like surface antigen